MNTIALSGKNAVKMIAHRGLSGLERENTAAAFVAACNRSYYGVETDVRRTRDGQFVLCHDDTTERCTGTRLAPEASTLAEVRALRCADIDGAHDRGDLVIPTLHEYVKICKRYEKRCILELKDEFDPSDLAALLSEIDAVGYADGVTFIAFSFDNLVRLRALRPDAPAQWLTGELTQEDVERLIRHGIGLDAWHGCLTREIVTQLHAANLDVNCWTVDDPADARRLIDIGVDMITTNILE